MNRKNFIFSGFLAIGTFSASLANISIDTVPVGPPGNADDATGFGRVDYGYDIGTYEVTNAQYAAFLNAVASADPHALWNGNMQGGDTFGGGIDRTGSSGNFAYSVTAGAGNEPVRYVSFWDAARFANWLTNGQGNADTESGVYDLTNPAAIANNTVTRDTTYGFGTLNALWAIASEDEWYKAAYYDPSLNGGTGGYYDYPTGSNTAPANGSPPGGSNSANYNANPNSITDVGSYANSSGFFGTFDQGGNLWEWNDTMTGNNRVLRGGWFFGDQSFLASSHRHSFNPANSNDNTVGFRVSTFAPVPEPETYAALLGLCGLASALVRRRERQT